MAWFQIGALSAVMSSLVDERSDLCLGTAALSSGDYLHSAIECADLIINVSHDVVEKPPFLMEEGGKKVIHVNYKAAKADLRLMQQCGKTIGPGFLLTLVASYMIGVITPSGATLPEEVLARGGPNVLDLLIAVFSAAAATFAMARPNKLSDNWCLAQPCGAPIFDPIFCPSNGRIRGRSRDGPSTR